MRLHLSAAWWLVPLAGVPAHARLDRPISPQNSAPARVIVNDNRRPAGTLRARRAHAAYRGAARRVASRWRGRGRAPSCPRSRKLVSPARIPGPLIRVPAGHRSRAVAAQLAGAVAHRCMGSHDRIARHELERSRRATCSSSRLAPRARFAFASARRAPTTTTARREQQTIDWRAGDDAQFSGAIVVDPPGARR